MDLDVLKYLLIVTALALAVGLPFGWPSRKGKEKYDERQLIEQGRASRIAMTCGMCYLFCCYGGVVFRVIPGEYMLLLMVFGIMLMATVYQAWCIFHDASMLPDESVSTELLRSFSFAAIWFFLGVTDWDQDRENAWINLMLSFVYASEGILYLVRMPIIRLKARREAED